MAYGRSGPANSDSLTYLDNLRIDEGGISITATHPQERYLHSDHLGSIVAVTDNQGRILERSSYDVWGKRRSLTGLDDQVFDDQGLGILPSLSTHHGFTGHEMLDDMTLVHMNGRLYDPIIARFISADPHIDGLYSTQGLNSYSYVHNNPLNATDPSGYFLKKIFKGIKKALSGLNKIAKSIRNEMYRPLYKGIRALGPVAQPLVAVGSILCGPGYAACVAAGNYHVARANGASTIQGLRIGAVSGAIAYAGAYAANGIGNATTTLVDGAYTMSAGQAIANVALHGVRGGITSIVSGGDFRSGFLAGSFGAFGDVTGLTASQYGAAIVGGIGSALGGGNFAEGAVIAIIGRRFNHEEHSRDDVWNRKAMSDTVDILVPKGRPYEGVVYEGSWKVDDISMFDGFKLFSKPVNFAVRVLSISTSESRIVTYGEIQRYNVESRVRVFDLVNGNVTNPKIYSHGTIKGTISRPNGFGMRDVREQRTCYGARTLCH